MVVDPSSPLTALLRLPAGAVDLAGLDPSATPGFAGKKSDAPAATAALAPEFSDLQERLYAVGRTAGDGAPRIPVLLQGMDTSGKGGVIRHAIGMVDPQGVQVKAFRAPTEAEQGEHYLGRIEREVPGPGMIGIFDRSQYEDVLVVRVNGLVPDEVWQARYEEINAFEQRLVDDGTVLIKCFLHISSAEQKERLLARLDDPSKHWKYNRVMSTSGPGGRTTRPRTPTRWSGAAPSRHPGTSSRRTGSGTATGRWPSCWSSTCGGWA